MKLRNYLLLLLILISAAGAGQNKTGLVSGPMLGQIEIRSAMIWLEVAPTVRKVEIRYYETGTAATPQSLIYKGELGKTFNPIKFELDGLKMNTTYSYQFFIDNKQVLIPYKTQFTTQDLWQWRKPAPDFSFLTGSCAYFNEPIFDRPGTPYGSDSVIFEAMANTQASFHLWLGDNWYTREADYATAWGLNYRASRDRATPVLQKFLAAMPQYAIWDDHDFGPNDANSSYVLKEPSKKIFDNYWCNPSSGEDGKGTYTKISYGDVDIFMLDDRYFRSADGLPAMIDGKPNPAKLMFGAQQMQWLENAIATSMATFKFIAIGSQVLNPLSELDCLRHFPVEYEQLLKMLERNKTNGVIFLSGDRHHSEIIKQQRAGTYTLYDVTTSAYTSGISKPSGKEINHPDRVAGTLVEVHNFAKISVSGQKNDRTVKVEFIGVKGEKLAEWSINEKELQGPKGE